MDTKSFEQDCKVRITLRIDWGDIDAGKDNSRLGC